MGKTSHLSSLGNWINSNDAPVCGDESPFSVWSEWGASQRDLFILDHEGNVALQQNVSGGLPSNLEAIVMNLIENIPLCDPDLVCGEAISCCDGLLYPTTCCAENCDDSIGACECTDGEVNNENPCNPMECYDGEWAEIIIDCAEQMGVPCEGGVYVQPPEDVCCSSCVQFGDTNNDGGINVLDVVSLVNYVLSGDYNQVSDMNGDGILNVLDIVSLISAILE